MYSYWYEYRLVVVVDIPYVHSTRTGTVVEIFPLLFLLSLYVLDLPNVIKKYPRWIGVRAVANNNDSMRIEDPWY